MGVSNQKSHRTLCEINITPFVDVMLVLLVIFMVTAPMMQQGLEVQLPETRSSTSLKMTEDPFILTIKKNGRVFMGTVEIPMAEIQSKLKSIFEIRKDKQIYIQADQKVYYGSVAETMGEIRSAGLTQISLITQLKD